MGQPKTVQRFGQTKALADKALELGTVTVQGLTENASRQLANRLSALRHRDRQETKKAYSPEDPEYDTSPYDALSFIRQEKEGDSWELVITTENIKGIGLRVLGPDGKEIEL